MRVTIEIDSQNELEKLSALFKAFKIKAVNVLANDDTNIPVIKGDKKIDPNALFNIWADKPRSLADIRNAGWKRS